MTNENYGQDKIEIPKDKGRSFLEIARILGEENYSGPFDGGEKDSYKFEPVDKRYNFVIINPVKGIMEFNYIFPEGKEQSQKRFLRIKKTIENKFNKELQNATRI